MNNKPKNKGAVKNALKGNIMAKMPKTIIVMPMEVVHSELTILSSVSDLTVFILPRS
jgi:hypothetical protein